MPQSELEAITAEKEIIRRLRDAKSVKQWIESAHEANESCESIRRIREADSLDELFEAGDTAATQFEDDNYDLFNAMDENRRRSAGVAVPKS